MSLSAVSPLWKGATMAVIACKSCGAKVNSEAVACPACWSDPRTGDGVRHRALRQRHRSPRHAGSVDRLSQSFWGSSATPPPNRPTSSAPTPRNTSAPEDVPVADAAPMLRVPCRSLALSRSGRGSRRRAASRASGRPAEWSLRYSPSVRLSPMPRLALFYDALALLRWRFES